MKDFTAEQMRAILDEVVDGLAYDDIGYYCRQLTSDAEFLATTLAESTTKAKELGMIDDLRQIQGRYSDLESINKEYKDGWR